MNETLNKIKENIEKAHDILYMSPSDFNHTSAKYDMEWLINTIEKQQQEITMFKGILEKLAQTALERIESTDNKLFGSNTP